jgi:hypothetical protein
MAPMMVLSTPRDRCGVSPRASIRWQTWAISSSVARGRNTMIM